MFFPICVLVAFPPCCALRLGTCHGLVELVDDSSHVWLLAFTTRHENRWKTKNGKKRRKIFSMQSVRMLKEEEHHSFRTSLNTHT